jgi:hypothetical protein
MDGYDFWMWFFPPQSGTEESSNPQHRAVHDNWEYFFTHSDGTTSCAVVSPFTVIELAASAAHHTEFRQFAEFTAKIKETYPAIDEHIRALATGMAKTGDLSQNQIEAIGDVYAKMLRMERVSKILSNPSVFGRLSDLMREKKIRPFDPLIPEAAQMGQLFASDSRRRTEAIKYLVDKRSERPVSRDFLKLYASLDVFHFIVVDNSRPTLTAQGIVPLLASSGVLSRNSWFKLKYDRMPSDLVRIPPEWAVSSAAAPAYRLRAVELCHGDVAEAEEFVVAARSDARRVLTALLGIPEIGLCAGDATARKRLHDENPPIRIEDGLLHKIDDYRSNYEDHLNPEPSIETDGDVSGRSVDHEQLHNFIESGADGDRAYKETIRMVGQKVKEAGLAPRNWRSYVSPLGEDAYELIVRVGKEARLFDV